jgi:hypothetical protein
MKFGHKIFFNPQNNTLDYQSLCLKEWPQNLATSSLTAGEISYCSFTLKWAVRTFSSVCMNTIFGKNVGSGKIILSYQLHIEDHRNISAARSCLLTVSVSAQLGTFPTGVRRGGGTNLEDCECLTYKIQS